jgi:hypothetical protein
VNEFIDHLYTPLGTTNNYSAIADLHTSKITAVPYKQFPACLHLPFPSSGFNSADSSASRAQVMLSQPSARNSCQVTTNWVSGLQPFHTSLLVFSSQADFQLTTEPSHSPTSHFTSLHSTELLTTPLTELRNSTDPAYNISARIT